jgi:hypothetical protein
MVHSLNWLEEPKEQHFVPIKSEISKRFFLNNLSIQIHIRCSRQKTLQPIRTSNKIMWYVEIHKEIYIHESGRFIVLKQLINY